MIQFLSLNATLQSTFRLNNSRDIVRNSLIVLGGSLLIALASKISIPFEPVPITLQTMAVFFIGMTLGARLAVATLLCYCAELAFGLPFAAGSSIGLSIFTGATGGYILGWFFAAAISGFLVERGWGTSRVGCFLAQIIGSIPLYTLGVFILSRFVGLKSAIDFGLTPFILGDLLKISFLSLMIPLFWKK